MKGRTWCYYSKLSWTRLLSFSIHFLQVASMRLPSLTTASSAVLGVLACFRPAALGFVITRNNHHLAVFATTTKLSMAVAASDKSQLAQLAGMTTLSIDSGDLKVIEEYAKTGYITDATTNPLFVSQAGLSGDPTYAEVRVMLFACLQVDGWMLYVSCSNNSKNNVTLFSQCYNHLASRQGCGIRHSSQRSRRRCYSITGHWSIGGQFGSCHIHDCSWICIYRSRSKIILWHRGIGTESLSHYWHVQRHGSTKGTRPHQVGRYLGGYQSGWNFRKRWHSMQSDLNLFLYPSRRLCTVWCPFDFAISWTYTRLVQSEAGKNRRRSARGRRRGHCSEENVQLLQGTNAILSRRQFIVCGSSYAFDECSTYVFC